MKKNNIPSEFERRFFGADEKFSLIGSGSVGGKAEGLGSLQRILKNHKTEWTEFPGLEISIPRLAVLGTHCFKAFLERNRLEGVALSDEPDERIIREFLKADMPAEYAGDLLALVEDVHSPLAVRSSSLLEDALNQPFAGIYQTKMIPNNQPEPDVRFARLVEAVKFVYASCFSRSAKMYRRALKNAGEESMAVIIQEVVGARHGNRFYPELSGVARSWNFYPLGTAKPQEGVVQLALGLGKTIVDGGLCWTYSPSRPGAGPPFANVNELAEQTQSSFWSVNMGTPPAYDPVKETEYLLRSSLADAEEDGVLGLLASTLNRRSDRLSVGIADQGTRILNFAPLLVLKQQPLNEIVRKLLKACEEDLSTPVEIEFAMTFKPLRFACLQVRRTFVSSDVVELSEADLIGEGVLAASEKVCGNGTNREIRDVVYIPPERFDKGRTAAIAAELETVNRRLLDEARQSLLIGFGRWGSSDPWLGIPVNWGQISSARAIIEATLPEMNVDLSQGSHFFHNLTSFGVSYFSIHHEGSFSVDWHWLAQQQVVSQGVFVRHARLRKPLTVQVDGRKGIGVVRR